MSNQQSDVEKYYYNLTKHFGNRRQWSELDLMEQMQFVQAINVILQIVSR
jgi:hypothetical protein